MAEVVLDASALPLYLTNILQAKKVIVIEANQVITIMPAVETNEKKDYSCPFLGIAMDSKITVDRFLEWKKEERDAEYEKELHS